MPGSLKTGRRKSRVRKSSRKRASRVPSASQESDCRTSSERLSSALAITRYSERSKALFAWGKQEWAKQGNSVWADINLLSDSTAEALGSILAARGVMAQATQTTDDDTLAECASAASALGLQLSAHPSALVRRVVLEAHLLTVADARAMFLSDETAKTTQRDLVRTRSVVCDAATLGKAREMGSFMQWRLLCTTEDETLFRRYGSLPHDVPSRVALRFPKILLESAVAGSRRWEWHWVREVVQVTPEAAIKTVLSAVGQHAPNSLLLDHLVEWAWKKQYPQMLNFTLNEACHCRTKLQLLQGMPRAHKHVSFQRRKHAVVAVFAKLKETSPGANLVACIPLLPTASSCRPNQCAELLNGFWELVDGTRWGRTQGSTNPWAQFLELHKSARLPADVLAAEFLKQKDEKVQRWVGDQLGVFTFFMDVDKIDDELRLKLLEAYLSSKQVTASFAVSLFSCFLKHAKSSTALRRAFDALHEALGVVVRGQLQAVVAKMEALEAAEEQTRARKRRQHVDDPAAEEQDLRSIAASAEALPCSWLLFCAVDGDGKAITCVDPLQQFLLHSLLTCVDESVLATLCQRFGRAVFWRLFESVLMKNTSDVLTRATTSSAPPPVALLNSLHVADQTQLIASEDGGQKAQKGASPVNASAETRPLGRQYLSSVEGIKARTVGRDQGARQQAYLDLVRLCANVNPQQKASVFADAVPFMVKRLHSEQENVKFAVLPGLLSPTTFPAALWGATAKEYLTVLWRVCVNARTCNTRWRDSFQTVSKELVSMMLADWDNRSADVQAVVTEALEPAAFAAKLLAHWATPDGTAALPSDAVEWLLNAACSNPTSSGILDLTSSLATLFEGDQGRVWREIPGLPTRWAMVHRREVRSNQLAQVLTTCVERITAYNVWRTANHPTSQPWWDPITHPAYTQAVTDTLARLGRGEVTTPESTMKLLSARLKALLDSTVPGKSVSMTEVAQAAKATLQGARVSKLRPVLVEAHKMAHQSEICHELVYEAITRMDAAEEGRARLVAAHDVELAKQLLHADLLSVLLDQYLGLSPSADVLDQRVMSLCASRKDAHLLLFFGTRFVTHLCLRRQDQLHALLLRLTLPPSLQSPVSSALGSAPSPLEFYHWESPASFAHPYHAMSRIASRAPTLLLHSSTQQLLLDKGMAYTTEVRTLELLPKLEYVDCIDLVSNLLSSHPKERSATVAASVAASDASFVLVGEDDSLVSELSLAVGRRFAELNIPTWADDVQKHHMDVLVLNLGRSDNSDASLKVLSKYAGWHKLARDALIRIIKALSLPHARRVIHELLSGTSMGLSTQVHILRLALELKLDNPLQMCLTAYKGGACHRDVLATMLGRLSCLDLTPEEIELVRPLYILRLTDKKQTDEEAGESIGSARSPTDLTYICKQVLQDLNTQRTWKLPFLADVLLEWAHFPELAHPSFQTLLRGIPTSSTIPAITQLLADARLLKDFELHDCRELAQTWNQVTADTVVSTFNRNMWSCPAAILRPLVFEVFRDKSAQSTPSKKYLELWMQLIRGEEPGQDEADLAWLSSRIVAHEDAAVRATSYRELADVCVQYAHTQRAPDLQQANIRAIAAKAVELAWNAAQDKATRNAIVVELGAKLALASSHSEFEEFLRRTNLPESKDFDPVVTVSICKYVVEKQTALADASSKTVLPLSASWAAIEWLCNSPACTETANGGLSCLAELCATMVRVHRSDGDLGRIIAIMDKVKLHSSECVHFVSTCMTFAGVSRSGDKQRALIDWLTPITSAKAIAMYPAMLKVSQDLVRDVSQLLKVCEEHSLDVPWLPAEAIKTNVASLLSSSINSARVQAIRWLGNEKDATKIQPLLADSSDAVRAVARAMLKRLQGVETVVPCD